MNWKELASGYCFFTNHSVYGLTCLWFVLFVLSKVTSLVAAADADAIGQIGLCVAFTNWLVGTNSGIYMTHHGVSQ